MSNVRGGSIADRTTEASADPIVATLCVVDGAVVEDPTRPVLALTPPARVARGRENERLFLLFDPTDAATPHLCRELHEMVTQTYWTTSGSVTAALRRTTSVANRYLFEHNLNAEPAQRCYGGLSCAVLCNNDLFLLEAGPVWACVLQGKQLRCFPRAERLAHIGIGPVADVRLHHVLVATGDTLLLASSALLRNTDREGLIRVLAHADLDGVRSGLEQLGGGADFTALVARWVPSPIEAPGVQALPSTQYPEAPLSDTLERAETRETRKPLERQRTTKQRVARARSRGAAQLPADEWIEPTKGPSVSWGEKLMAALRRLGQGLGYLWHGVAAAGAGVASLAKWVVGAIGTTIRRTLPGPEREAYRRVHRRSPPKEKPGVMMAVAAAVPILVIVVVTVAYLRLAVQSRFEGAIGRAKEQIVLARSAESDSAEARAHWEQALQQIEIAAALQPENASAQALREQAREALDRVDRVQRLTLAQLVEFGSSGAGRRLVIQGQIVFVLDAQDGWGARVPGNGATGQPESEDDLVLVHTGQEVDGEDVGPLVDCAWVGREGGRRSSALLVLEEDGGLVSYDPAWGSETGAPQLTRAQLSSPPPGRAVAAGSYGGQFYILAVTAESTVQIWRYRPTGDAYLDQPERYFATPPSTGSRQVLDMAIDGHIYVLYSDGTVEKYLSGEPQQFEIRDVPGGFGQVAGFAVDPNGSGTVYVADPDNQRIVELAPDGRFKTQLRAGEAFAALEAVAVNEADRRLYVLEEGRLHVASLP